MVPSPPGDEGFGLYIHWPFCLSKCPYCDFNSHVAERIDQARWRAALLRELETAAAPLRGRVLTSIFFGGGTPSLMDPDTAAELIAAARRLFTPAADLEISLEANPGAVDRGRFAAFRQAGINRASIGVQSLEPGALAFLGRRHDVTEARSAIEAAAALFPRWSFDLICARPGQSLDGWRRELREALALASGGHLSLYHLTIEAGTRFHTEYQRGAFALPPEDEAVAFYDTTQEMMEAAGLPAYEISNHARPGEACRHNLTYWRGGDYVGIGPGAHQRVTLDPAHQRVTLDPAHQRVTLDPAHQRAAGEALTTATRRHRAPEIWMNKVEATGDGTAETIILSSRERQEELILMGLRLRDGIDRARFARLTGVDLDTVVDASAVALLAAEGLLVDPAGPALRLTPAGRLVLDAVIQALLA